MADVAGPAKCEACGRQLPPQQGKGRRRRYCDARCRDAARRSRERNERDQNRDVKESLTRDTRQGYVYAIDVPEAADPVAIAVRDKALRLIGALAGPEAETAGSAGSAGTAGTPLEVVAAARDLSSAATAAMQAAVDRARAAGHSWREIGDVLETTRQAAFQRFGRPVDPRTGTPMVRHVPPGVEDRAIEILGCIIEGRWEDSRRDFGEQMLEAIDADRIARAWTQTIAEVGRYERMGEPIAFQANDLTIVDIPLYMEAGERTGRVVFDQAGKVAGLLLRPPSP